jgi:hypothetical protein
MRYWRCVMIIIIWLNKTTQKPDRNSKQLANEHVHLVE